MPGAHGVHSDRPEGAILNTFLEKQMSVMRNA